MSDPSSAKVFTPANRIVERRQAAARDLPSVEILGRVLASGSDARISIHTATGRNGYGCRAAPCLQALAFSSSTASTISVRAFEAAEAAYSALFMRAADDGLPVAFEAATEALRREIRLLLEIDGGDGDIVFSPSGTDSEIHALYLARLALGQGGITSIVVAADETGSGVPLAAAGRHFSGTTSAGVVVAKGQPISGMEGVTHVAISARNGHGPRTLKEIDAEVSQAAARAVADGQGVVLHVMHHSKIGTRGPSAGCIDALRAEHGMKVQFVLDACQCRLSRRRLRQYLDRGFLVLVTGSKFFAGPPLSGAMIVPEQFRARIVSGSEIPSGLADYSAACDWPESLAGIGAQLPRRENLGQYLRWVAACAEMKAYFAVPELYRRLVLGEFSRAATRAIAQRSNLALLPEPAWIPEESDAEDEFGIRTVLPFVVKRDGVPVSMAESRAIYKALNDDVCEIVDFETPAQARLAATLCHIGQPVSMMVDGAETGALRIAADARLVSDCFANTGMMQTIDALKQKNAQIDILLDKVVLLVKNLDRLTPIYTELA